jgi:hypothetical protein
VRSRTMRGHHVVLCRSSSAERDAVPLLTCSVPGVRILMKSRYSSANTTAMCAMPCPSVCGFDAHLGDDQPPVLLLGQRQ